MCLQYNVWQNFLSPEKYSASASFHPDLRQKNVKIFYPSLCLTRTGYQRWARTVTTKEKEKEKLKSREIPDSKVHKYMALQNQQNWACSQKRTSESFNLFSYHFTAELEGLVQDQTCSSTDAELQKEVVQSAVLQLGLASTSIGPQVQHNNNNKKQEREDKDLNVTGQLVAQQQLGSFWASLSQLPSESDYLLILLSDERMHWLLLQKLVAN